MRVRPGRSRGTGRRRPHAPADGPPGRGTRGGVRRKPRPPLQRGRGWHPAGVGPRCPRARGSHRRRAASPGLDRRQSGCHAGGGARERRRAELRGVRVGLARGAAPLPRDARGRTPVPPLLGWRQLAHARGVGLAGAAPAVGRRRHADHLSSRGVRHRGLRRGVPQRAHHSHLPAQRAAAVLGSGERESHHRTAGGTVPVRPADLARPALRGRHQWQRGHSRRPRDGCHEGTVRSRRRAFDGPFADRRRDRVHRPFRNGCAGACRAGSSRAIRSPGKTTPRGRPPWWRGTQGPR